MQSVNITIPLKTEVIREHGNLVTGTEFIEREGMFIDMDVRRAPWKKLLDLPHGTEVGLGRRFANRPLARLGR